MLPASSFTKKGNLHDFKVILTKSTLLPAPSPGWGREKLSEFTSEVLWLGLVSKDVLIQP